MCFEACEDAPSLRYVGQCRRERLFAAENELFFPVEQKKLRAALVDIDFMIEVLKDGCAGRGIRAQYVRVIVLAGCKVCAGRIVGNCFVEHFGGEMAHLIAAHDDIVAPACTNQSKEECNEQEHRSECIAKQCALYVALKRLV